MVVIVKASGAADNDNGSLDLGFRGEEADASERPSEMEIVGASAGQRRARAHAYKRDYDRDHDRRPPPIQECGAQSRESSTSDQALVPGWLDDCEMAIGY